MLCTINLELIYFSFQIKQILKLYLHYLASTILCNINWPTIYVTMISNDKKNMWFHIKNYCNFSPKNCYFIYFYNKNMWLSFINLYIFFGGAINIDNTTKIYYFALWHNVNVICYQQQVKGCGVTFFPFLNFFIYSALYVMFSCPINRGHQIWLIIYTTLWALIHAFPNYWKT